MRERGKEKEGGMGEREGGKSVRERGKEKEGGMGRGREGEEEKSTDNREMRMRGRHDNRGGGGEEVGLHSLSFFQLRQV